MTWIPCGYCHDAPCVCNQTYRPLPYYPATTTTTTLKWPPETHLSNADVERIAKRVVELLEMSRNKKLVTIREVADEVVAFEGSG